MHISQGNANVTIEKHIANLIAENFAQASSIHVYLMLKG